MAALLHVGDTVLFGLHSLAAMAAELGLSSSGDWPGICWARDEDRFPAHTDASLGHPAGLSPCPLHAEACRRAATGEHAG